MENSTKFVGNGRAIGAKIQLTLKWADLLKLTKNEFKGQKLLTIDVLPLKKKSQFGQTHTVVEHVFIPKDA